MDKLTKTILRCMQTWPNGGYRKWPSDLSLKRSSFETSSSQIATCLHFLFLQTSAALTIYIQLNKSISTQSPFHPESNTPKKNKLQSPIFILLPLINCFQTLQISSHSPLTVYHLQLQPRFSQPFCFFTNTRPTTRKLEPEKNTNEIYNVLNPIRQLLL